MDNLQQPPMGTPEMGGMSPEGVPEMGGMSPEGIPEMGGMLPEGAAPQQMATSEQRQGLLDMIESIRQKLGSFNATQFAGKNKMERVRQEILRKVFEILQLSGVDLTDRESVAQFLENLRTQNPELAGWFEESMNVLLGETTPVAATAPEQEPYENTNQIQGAGEILPQEI